ncbi:Predicted DNA-binding transcriptional regulator YafY, contains an HTH and WYL domains [Ruminococcus sp. YE71]|uniref:helix-turn-helix transcriptional regulator n=1 Tax=unclassified Ruminococcus TaxID=2608920 RepID=UPI0008805213|nr:MULTISPECIES: WYL domain-containing protein [unclassified Ruminococcus]SDA11648.1 Predicted DNA-binding transcriptional regulator YafY, contains an HTH and WYL domains [Ruminococcus sp. YE78]SFW15570.1 Predicted DNA-binding transcriptional regulator YafY, contains an HTH and WYL domains [Ruminococcus sp. YE71]
MAGVSRQKQKLLQMEQLFSQRTDETHAITGNQLIDILKEMGIKAERKTIYDDIATLCDAGLDIRTTKSGHSNAYYMASRQFTDEELRILVDAVASSRFLTIKRSGELIRKLQKLTSEYKAPALRRNIHIENRTKSSNDQTYNIVDTVNEAVLADKQVSVTLSETGADKKRQGRRTAISPFLTVWENEHYYIICRLEEENGGIVRLRADRLSDPELLDRKREGLTQEEEVAARKLKAPLENHEGLEEKIRIRFDKSIIDDVFDRFGDKVAVRQESGNDLSVDVSVQLSAAFWGWLFGFGERAAITSPSFVREMAAERLTSMAVRYKND